MYDLFYSTTAIYRSFLLLLDEAEHCIQTGRTPIFLTCDGSLTQYCFTNTSGCPNVCKLCRWMRKKAFTALSKDVKNITIASLLSEAQIQSIKEMHFDYKCISDISDIHYKKTDIGYAAISHYIVCTRNYSPSITPELRKVIDGFLRTSIYLIEAIDKLVEQFPISKVSLFNGRTFDSRPALRRFVALGVETSVVEVIVRNQSYEKVYFKNSLPHNVSMQGERVLSLWKTAIEKDQQEAIQIAETFFNKRRHGLAAGDRVYTAAQEINRLPAHWDIQEQNIVFFTSSEDEFAAIDKEWDSYKYSSNQIECVKKILTFMLSNEAPCHLYVRLHPNLKGIKYAYHTDFYQLEHTFTNVTVIPPESPISTYALIDSSDKVIVFGSTVGIESVYWHKPVILLGPAYYRNLGGCYIPKDDNELKKMLSHTLTPKDNISALQYGYSIMGDVGKACSYIDVTLFWPDLFLKKIVKNAVTRKKILKTLLPTLNRSIKFFQNVFHSRASRQLHNLSK